MATKLVFLGTGGDSTVMAKQARSTGGIIIKIDDLQLHLDPGPSALYSAKLNDINIRETTALLISNNKLIHSSELNAMIEGMTYFGLDKKGVLIANKTVVEKTETTIPILLESHKDFLERIIILEPESKVGIGTVEIHAIESKFKKIPTIGFKIYTPDVVIGYPSDTLFSSKLAKKYSDVDILILNVTFPKDTETKSTLNRTTAIEFIKKINPRLCIITHFGQKMLKSDPIYEAREIQKATNVQILAAKDGLALSPSFYDAKSRQKRLLDLSEYSK